jgi:alkanesulfonate monooxygenase
LRRSESFGNIRRIDVPIALRLCSRRDYEAIVMSRQRRADQMMLGVIVHPTGNHVASWLHPEAQIDAGTNLNHYIDVAQAAERGKFDFMFLADAIATRDGNLNALSRWPQYMVFFDPLMLLAALASHTKHLGLVATVTTSYNEPYNVARRLASLDHLSGGRCGWNVVTSGNVTEAFNFGRDEHFAHGERYGRASEFVEVVKGLWDSWDDDAFLRDRQTSRYFDPEKLHYLSHVGEHFSVRGPLNTARPPQGYPVIFQASASDTGKELAGRIAEVVFTPLHDLAQAKAIYGDLKARAVKQGRRPEHLKVVPGLNPIVGRTKKEAEEKFAYLQSLIHPDVGKELLSNALRGLDLSSYGPEDYLPDEVVARFKAEDTTRYGNLFERRRTIREMYQIYAGARGQRTILGSPAEIADEMTYWFEENAIDGFLVHPSVFPTSLNEFVDLVIPELQERGVFRKEYAGTTFRETIGLPRPPSRYAATHAPAEGMAASNA